MGGTIVGQSTLLHKRAYFTHKKGDSYKYKMRNSHSFSSIEGMRITQKSNFIIQKSDFCVPPQGFGANFFFQSDK